MMLYDVFMFWFAEVIDICSADGISKGLFRDLEGNAKKYFINREFCHVVLVVKSKK